MEFSGSIWCILFSCFSLLVCSQQEKLSNKLSNSNEQKHEIILSQSPFYSFNWELKKSKNGRYEVLFKISVDSKLNWVGFGFVSASSKDTSNDEDDETEMPSADWFIAWKDRRERVHFKDCNTMKSTLHFDKSKDYHVIAKSRPKSLNLLVTRYVDTYDDHDVKLKPGNMRMVWAYGNANSFSEIKSEIEFTRKQQNLVLFSTTELDSPVDHDKETKTKPVDSKQTKKFSTKGKETSLPSANTSAVLDGKKTNCTVIIQEDTHWYEILKLKQENVFYAIIGASAILASMIVFALACCCAKKQKMRMPPSKMAFYKVDDDDEEQVEFLKERA